MQISATINREGASLPKNEALSLYPTYILIGLELAAIIGGSFLAVFIAPFLALLAWLTILFIGPIAFLLSRHVRNGSYRYLNIRFPKMLGLAVSSLIVFYALVIFSTVVFINITGEGSYGLLLFPIFFYSILFVPIGLILPWLKPQTEESVKSKPSTWRVALSVLLLFIFLLIFGSFVINI